MSVNGRFQFRRDTAANWTAANPTLASGELALETDTAKFKIGDGATAWSSLAYGGIAGPGVPSGGTTGQILQKVDGTNYNTAWATPSWGKNKIINGAMLVDQRNNGAAVTPTASTYTLDRWVSNLSVASKLTFQQVTDAPSGFKNSLKVTVASQYSPAAGDSFGLTQYIEGLNVIDFALGTSGATYITLSAQVKSSVTGTFACRFINGANNRSYVATYTISAANTWTPLALTIQGDVTGTWATDTSIGLQVYFDLGCGTNYNTTAGSWQAGNYTRTSGSVTFVNQTAGATWQITGVQLEKGNFATPFEWLWHPTVFAACQRYYQTLSYAPGAVATATRIDVVANFPTPMRAAPTTTLLNGTSAAVQANGAAQNITSIAAVWSGAVKEGLGVGLTCSGASFSNLQSGAFMIGTNGPVLGFSAEL